LASWRWVLQLLTRKLWFRASLLAALGVATALLATLVDGIIPDDLSTELGARAVERILEILASSMLVVTTFSLSVLVSAHNAATANVTPRAAKLLVEDPISQNVLAVFIGTFLFSLVGIAALTTNAYGDEGRFVLFVVTIGVIGLVVAALLRWIDYLSSLGHVSTISDRVEEAAAAAIRDRAQNPTFGAAPLDRKVEDLPDVTPVYPSRTGYIQNIDVGQLSQLAETLGEIYVVVLPGAFVSPSSPILWVKGEADERIIEARAELESVFAIGNERTFDQDPRFGIAVMAEIASRALSPGINDPGTAINVVGRLVRLLRLWLDRDERAEIVYPRVFVPRLRTDDFFQEAFFPPSRDGAGHVEVQIAMVEALRSLQAAGNEAFRRSATKQLRSTMARAMERLTFDADRERLDQAAGDVDRADDPVPR